MKIQDSPSFQNHELVLDLGADGGDVQGFIGIHNTHLGPALGGTRVYNYSNKESALEDVLRLSRAMTYKCAIAGLPFGGGKGVIIADQANVDMQKVLKAYAQKVDTLKGKFYTGEDVGLSEAQVQYMLGVSPYFIGKTGLAGDPSKYASMSVFLCMQVALEHVFGTAEMTGKKFAVKGVGKTGSELAAMIGRAGGIVYVYDIDSTKVELLAKLHPNIQPVSLAELEEKEVDAYAPCALGGDLNMESLEKLRAPIIAGTANNQLAEPKVAELLFQKGILHVPDYIANAGGLINVADELMPGGYNKNRVLENINKLKIVLKEVLDESKKSNINPDAIADKMAEKIFQKGKA